MKKSAKEYQRFRIVFRNGKTQYRKATNLSEMVKHLPEVPASVRQFSNKKNSGHDLRQN